MTLDEVKARVSPCPITGCWWWVGAAETTVNRPHARINGKIVKVSRLLLEDFTGKRVTDCALHTCDNPACVNPEHLYDGTKQQNAMDAVNRGRYVGKRGQTHCIRGHELSGDNLYKAEPGRRVCRICKRLTRAAREAKMRAQVIG